MSYSDLYPVLDKTVFILGTASMQMSPNNLQYIKVSLPVTVGSMVRQIVSTPGHVVNYVVNQGSLHLTNTVRYPSNLPFPVAAPPKSWFLEGALGLAEFKHWTSNTSIGGVSTWYPGQIVNDTADSVSTMTSQWKNPILVVRVTYDMTTNGTFVWDSNNPLQNHSLSEIGSATSVRAWAVGGGGMGGFTIRYAPTKNNGAGGGGSGGYDSCSMGLPDTTLESITLTVGNGGTLTTLDGGTTSVSLNFTSYNTELISVSGGLLGGDNYHGSNGGRGGSPGGTAGAPMQGSTGGAGGSVPGLENGLQLGNFTLTSVGGAGGTSGSGGNAGQGYGAGGGGAGAALSTSGFLGGDGAPGVIILAFYE